MGYLTRVYHARDPFTGMNIRVPDDGWLCTAPRGTENIDTRDCTTFNRSSSGDHLGIVGICSRQIGEKCEMVRVRMVGIEPCGSGKAAYRVTEGSVCILVKGDVLPASLAAL
jgi:hypothetical protein